MYYLAKFCRICIKTGQKMVDIATVDFDGVSFSQKLEECTKMIINRESLSTEICQHCVKKLRTSYDFQNICKQSTKILQGYLTELISTSEKICPDSFVNSDVRVTLTPLEKSTVRRKRITKEQRCSLLKRLLSRTREPPRRKKQRKGGLRNILDFTRNYDFGYPIPPNLTHSEDPLSKLTNFTKTFFSNNFIEFRNTIIYIIENKDALSDSDDDADLFADEDAAIKAEELIIEPDIKIKTELDYDEDEAPYSCNYYVETSYSDSECTKENYETASPSGAQPQSAVQMLDKLVDNVGFPNRKPFSRNSVRCRTRDNPYINPQLRQQFQLKSFKCDKCQRYFKSPGYLKAHNSKIHLVEHRASKS